MLVKLELILYGWPDSKVFKNHLEDIVSQEKTEGEIRNKLKFKVVH